MLYVLFVFLCFALFLSVIRFKKIFCPLVFLNSLFTIIVFGLVLHLYPIYLDNDLAYTIILIGMMFINIGFHIVGKDIKVPSSINKDGSIIEMESLPASKINVTFLYIAIILLSYFTAYYVFEFISLSARGYSLNMIRMFYFGNNELLESETTISRNKFVEYGTVYVYNPLQFIFIALSSIFVFSKNNTFGISKKMRILVIAITLINIAISMITNGGRMILYFFVVTFALCFLIFRQKKKKKGKRLMKYAIILVGIISLVFVAVYVTRERTDSTIIQSLYYYFCGCIPNMQIKIDTFGNGDFTYGLVFVSGLVRPVFAFLRIIFGISLPEGFIRSDMFLANASAQDFIAPGVKYNAFVTIFYFFYRDSGFLGVLIFSFLLGVVSALLYNSMNKGNGRIKNILLFLLMMEGLSISFIRWQILSVGYSLSFVYVHFLMKRGYKNE